MAKPGTLWAVSCHNPQTRQVLIPRPRDPLQTRSILPMKVSFKSNLIGTLNYKDGICFKLVSFIILVGYEVIAKAKKNDPILVKLAVAWQTSGPARLLLPHRMRQTVWLCIVKHAVSLAVTQGSDFSPRSGRSLVRCGQSSQQGIQVWRWLRGRHPHQQRNHPSSWSYLKLLVMDRYHWKYRT